MSLNLNRNQKNAQKAGRKIAMIFKKEYKEYFDLTNNEVEMPF